MADNELLNKIYAVIQGISEDISVIPKMQSDISSINIRIENHLIPNIQEVARAHLDLGRKLDEALKFEKAREEIQLKINYHDGEIRRLSKKAEELMR